MKESEFLKLAMQEIQYIQDALENSTTEEILDIDMLDDILYIKLTNARVYVINKHSMMKELWLSSPISGAYHFAYNPTTSKWLDKKKNDIRTLLCQELRVTI